ncbi:MAG: carbohydrate ABC transporter substrate-binding protein, partial [Marmoricola sp.]
MRPTSARRRTAALAALLLGAGLALSACGDDGDSASAGGKSPGEGKAECEGLTSYGDLTGKTVKVYTSIVAPEADSQKKSYELFTKCTGAKIAYEGSREFEAQLVVRAKSGNPPDIAYVPQPGLLATLVKDTGKVVEAPKGTS